MKFTDSEKFQEEWEDYLNANPSTDELIKVLSETSPHHPNPNMVWLHDRLLMKIAGI